ncbi:MAG TPA: serpin family protein [Verrucomicrobiae bacterium]|nr:serpin family protein [Verrucomicrobiae bacterium]
MILSLAVLLFALLAAGFSQAAPAPSVQSVVNGNTEFALDLYQREKGSAPNLFFSPYSISSALAMTYAGAAGKTAGEMAHTLHFDQAGADLPRSFAAIDARFEEIQAGKRVELSVANSLWCQTGYPFTPAFLDVNKTSYHAELREVDFKSKSEATRKEINSWIERKTRDKIRDLLQPGQIDSATRLLLCNAIYFKGNWASQFDPKATRPEPFFISSNQNISVPTMSRQGKVRSRNVDAAMLIALPYAGEELWMVIVLPNEKDGLAAVEQALNAATLQGWWTTLQATPEKKAILTLPKFKLNSRLDLANQLEAMGMKSAFGPGADFSGMTGKGDLFISRVVHQAYVDVNEQGTEAAAATSVGMAASAIVRPHELRVDHPFLFFIMERQTGSVLFLGRVTDPSAAK